MANTTGEVIITCPFCGEIMLYQGSDMHFWKCPACDAEVWPGDDNINEEDMIMEVYTEEVYRRSIIRKGRSSGSRSKRFRRKKVPPPLDWRYRC